eukprot:11011379-Lingulodinium_polyedra.AAC.1
MDDKEIKARRMMPETEVRLVLKARYDATFHVVRVLKKDDSQCVAEVFARGTMSMGGGPPKG